VAFIGGEVFGWALRGRAVHPHAGRRGAPRLDAVLCVGHPHGRARATKAAPLHRKTVQRPVGHDDAAAGQLAVDVRQLQVLLEPTRGCRPRQPPAGPRPGRGPDCVPAAPRQSPRRSTRRSIDFRHRRGPARPPSQHRHNGGQSCDPHQPAPRSGATRARYPASDAKPLEPRAHEPPGTPPATSRPNDLDRSQTAGLDHPGRRAEGGPMTGKSGGPMTVAKPGSNRSHHRGRRHPGAVALRLRQAS
jgi:hypothetical protein